MPLDIRREIAALPDLAFDAEKEPSVSGTEPSPIQVISRQGRLILRLSAAAEGLDLRYAELARQLEERDSRIQSLADERAEAERQARQVALAAIHLMDALDWVHDSLVQQGQATFARDVEAALRDCLRRLAAVGVTEVPCDGPFDGHLHEGIDTLSTGEVPQYHIVKVVRRGFQRGADILRRAEVVTAA